MHRLRYPMMLTAILLACASSASFAQQQPPPPSACTLKQAPELHGLRLGMTIAEVKKSLEDPSRFDTKISSGNNVGSRAVNISASELSPERGEGVEGIYLTFVDNKVAHIKVTYNAARRWDGPQDFFVRLSESLNLPKPTGPDSYQGSGGNERYAVECGEFRAVLAYAFGVSPNVAVSNNLARQLVDKRRDKQEEEGTRQQVLSPISRPGARRDPLPPQTGEPRSPDPPSGP